MSQDFSKIDVHTRVQVKYNRYFMAEAKVIDTKYSPSKYQNDCVLSFHIGAVLSLYRSLYDKYRIYTPNTRLYEFDVDYMEYAA